MALLFAYDEGLAPRFLVPVIPFLLLGLITGGRRALLELTQRFERIPYPSAKRVVLTGLVVLIVTNFGYVGKSIYVSHRCDNLEWYKGGKYKPYCDMAAWLSEKGSTGKLVVLGSAQSGYHPLIHLWSGWIIITPADDSEFEKEVSFEKSEENVFLMVANSDLSLLNPLLDKISPKPAVRVFDHLLVLQVPREEASERVAWETSGSRVGCVHNAATRFDFYSHYNRVMNAPIGFE